VDAIVSKKTNGKDLLDNEASPFDFRQHVHILQNHFVSRNQDVELCNVVLSQFDDCGFRDKLLSVIEFMLTQIVSCVCRAVIKDNINVWSPSMELALPLSNQRQWRNNQEWSIYLSRSLRLQLSQKCDSLNCFPTSNMRQRVRREDSEQRLLIDKNYNCTYSPISSARIGERRFHQLKSSQLTPSS
jgi:hypothetical protein